MPPVQTDKEGNFCPSCSWEARSNKPLGRKSPPSLLPHIRTLKSLQIRPFQHPPSCPTTGVTVGQPPWSPRSLPLRKSPPLQHEEESIEGDFRPGPRVCSEPQHCLCGHYFQIFLRIADSIHFSSVFHTLECECFLISFSPFLSYYFHLFHWHLSLYLSNCALNAGHPLSGHQRNGKMALWSTSIDPGKMECDAWKLLRSQF